MALLVHGMVHGMVHPTFSFGGCLIEGVLEMTTYNRQTDRQGGGGRFGLGVDFIVDSIMGLNFIVDFIVDSSTDFPRLPIRKKNPQPHFNPT